MHPVLLEPPAVQPVLMTRMRRDDEGVPWPALRFPGDEEDDGETHICRGID